MVFGAERILSNVLIALHHAYQTKRALYNNGGKDIKQTTKF